MIHVLPLWTDITYGVAINTTSRSNDFGKNLSPFFLGPVDLYNGHFAHKMENAWQYTKVYKEHVDNNNNPTNEYWQWAHEGWYNVRAIRYPMGKGLKPLYSLWDDQRMDYITARRFIYIPLYVQAVKNTVSFRKLQKVHKDNTDITLLDFDAYDHTGCTWDQVINNPHKKMGHAFVLAMLLEGFI